VLESTTVEGDFACHKPEDIASWSVHTHTLEVTVAIVHTAKTPEDTSAEDTLAGTRQAGHKADFHTDSSAVGEGEEVTMDSQAPVPPCFVVAHTAHDSGAVRTSSPTVVPAAAPLPRARAAVGGGEEAGELADRQSLRCFPSVASTLRKRKGLSVVGSG
jgi:hypothetical protein